MKIKKIECPSCGYSFKLDNINKNNVCECPACKSYLYIDDEKEAPSIVNININNYGNTTNSSSNYEAYKNKYQIIGILFVFILIISISLNSYFKPGIGSSFVISQETRTVVESEPVVKFVENIFAKDLENISAEDYGKIAYLHVERNCPDSDWSNADNYPWRFDYAFSLDKEGEPVEAKSVLVYNDTPVEIKDIQAFTNIIRAEFGEYGNFQWDGEIYGDINFKNLEKLKYYRGDNFAYINEAFKDPSKIESIHVNNFSINSYTNVEISEFSNLKTLKIDYLNDENNLKEIAKFTNLENLSIDYLGTDKNTSLDFLSSLSKLKSLKIALGSETSIANTDIFYALPKIEKLSLDKAKNIKNIDFVNNMPKLHSFELSDIPILDIEPLRNKVSLSELSLNDLDLVEDLSPIESLTSLQKLKLVDMPDNADSLPNLAKLTLLKDIEIDAQYVDSLEGMSQIETLIASSSFDSNPAILSTLTSLENLEVDLYNFLHEEVIYELCLAISEHENLKSLKCNLLSVSDTYNVTPLFKSKNIVDLNLNNTNMSAQDIYLDFSEVEDNTSIKKLSLNNSMIIDINDNDGAKKLGAYADDFLSHFKGVEELYIRENEIKSLAFVKYMPNLKTLDIGDNYITDVSPLLECKNLETLICDNNSIKNLNILPEKVEVIRE